MNRSRSLKHEALESRFLFYNLSGYSWSDTNVSYSFLPDGSFVDDHSNSLFAELASVAEPAVWQREFARAVQTWASVSPLNFHEVNDKGGESSYLGPVQGHPDQGDIRVGAHPIADGSLAHAYYPISYHTIGGDLFLNSNVNFAIGATYDLFSLFLHETGHSLGLDHAPHSVMSSTYGGVLSGLTQDDINGIQAIYGERPHDSFDTEQANDAFASASPLALDANSAGSWHADLTTTNDSDFYVVYPPTKADGSLTIDVTTSGLSLLATRVSLYDSGHQLISETEVDYGENAKIDTQDLPSSSSFYIVVQGATDDVFGMGAYAMDVQFGTTEIGFDAYEPNDTLGTAHELGALTVASLANLNLHGINDTDVFYFETSPSGVYSISVVANFSHKLIIYDAAGTVVHESADAFEGWISGDYHVQVESEYGEVGSYDLAIELLTRRRRPHRWWA